jgi:hypothetical protein
MFRALYFIGLFSYFLFGLKEFFLAVVVETLDLLDVIIFIFIVMSCLSDWHLDVANNDILSFDDWFLIRQLVLWLWQCNSDLVDYQNVWICIIVMQVDSWCKLG